jgi:hypothetical protein
VRKICRHLQPLCESEMLHESSLGTFSLDSHSRASQRVGPVDRIGCLIEFVVPVGLMFAGIGQAIPLMKGFGLNRGCSPGGLLGASELAGLCVQRRWIRNKLRVEALLDPLRCVRERYIGSCRCCCLLHVLSKSHEEAVPPHHRVVADSVKSLSRCPCGLTGIQKPNPRGAKSCISYAS